MLDKSMNMLAIPRILLQEFFFFFSFFENV